PAFMTASTAMAVLACSHLMNATFGLMGYILVVGARSRMVFVNNVIATMVNVSLAWLLIPRFGIVGAAVAVLSGVSVGGVLVLVQVRMIYGIYPFGWATIKPFVAGAIAFTVELAIVRFVGLAAIRIPAVIVAGLVSCLAG